MNLHKRIENARVYLKRLQRSDEKTKKRYLTIASTIAMIVVIGLWFVYLNVSLPRVAVSEDKGSAVDAVALEREAGNNQSFIRIFERGLGDITHNVKEQFVSLKKRVVEALTLLNAGVEKTNEFSLEGKDTGFVFEEEDPILPTPLP